MDKNVNLQIHPAALQFHYPSGFLFVFPILYLQMRWRYSFFLSPTVRTAASNNINILFHLLSPTAYTQWFQNYTNNIMGRRKTFIFIHSSISFHMYSEIILFFKSHIVLSYKDVPVYSASQLYSGIYQFLVILHFTDNASVVILCLCILALLEMEFHGEFLTSGLVVKGLMRMQFC